MKDNAQERRTDDLYEVFGGYPKPPLPRIADVNDPASFSDIGIEPKTYRYIITKLALRITGFLSYYKTLPENLEKLLRKKNMRLPGLWAPVLSATSVLLDDPKKCDPFERAASLITAAYELYSDLITGKLEPDRYKDSIFEMGLYPNLFFSSLIIEKNGVKLFKCKPKFKINVLVRRQFYVLDLLDEGNFLSYRDIILALKEIVITSDKKRTKNEIPSIGLITAANNSTQFKAFKILKKDKESKAAIFSLNQAFLTLCLDIDSRPSSYKQAAFFAHNTNHGNRWYHSATQIVVFGNGKSAVIFNFTAYLDGITMARAGIELYKRSLSILPLDKTEIESHEAKSYSFQKLNWKFPYKYLRPIMRDIRLISDNQQATFEINNLGLTFFQKYNINPISTFVVALYMTVKELISNETSILQFVSMAKYRCMSLLTTDVVTKEVKDFVGIADAMNIGITEKNLSLHKAIESQKLAIRKTRNKLSLDTLFLYYIHSKSGLNKVFTILLTIFSSLLVGKIRLFDLGKSEIIISHPSISEQIPVFGRPGVRLPYLKYFGLHYQILENKIIITMMPSLKWQIPNAELVNILSNKLNVLARIISKDDISLKVKCS